MLQETATTAKTAAIGPGAIATASALGGPEFILSTTEWYAIQSYVISAQSEAIMPHTEEALRAYLGPGAPTNLGEFNPLIATYQGIYESATAWQKKTFPSSVSLASDIVAYARQVPVYYHPILKLAEQLSNNPGDESAKKELTAILDVLIKSADGYHTNAKNVATEIQTFADQTQQYKVQLSGEDGKGGLLQKYKEEFGSKGTEIVKLSNELKGQCAVLADANAEYEHDVVVASTSPSYAWVWPFGTIAAGVVAGVYGKRATDALDVVHAATANIRNLNAKIAADTNLMVSLNTIETGLGTNINSIEGALPVIQKIQGVWGAISNDLGNISQLIQTNIEEALPIIMGLGVEAAIEAWTAVGKEAQAYRVHAYITVKQ